MVDSAWIPKVTGHTYKQAKGANNGNYKASG